jgi:2-keto-4-pentenoate hydratase/2-oxohepta-3-ene-1,7-dioic acid hydratase in catechol pathway
MRIYRFQNNNKTFWGVASEADTQDLKYISGSIYEKWNIDAKVNKESDFRVLPPFDGSHVIGLAYNYKDLVGFSDNYEEPLVFFKSPTSVIGGKDSILIPSRQKRVDKVWVEVELAIVLKKYLFKATLADLDDAILGVTIANDVTANNVDNRDHHLARSKSLPTFCPIGDYLIQDLNTSSLQMSTIINGVTTQKGNTINRICNDYESLLFLSSLMPLYPGDLILTGTPKGALSSLIKPGDDVKLEIEKIGSLNNIITGEDR